MLPQETSLLLLVYHVVSCRQQTEHAETNPPLQYSSTISFLSLLSFGGMNDIRRLCFREKGSCIERRTVTEGAGECRYCLAARLRGVDQRRPRVGEWQGCACARHTRRPRAGRDCG